MLTLVRDTDRGEDIELRLATRAVTVAEIAAAPVRHVPPAFLTAVAGLFPDLLDPRVRRLANL